MMEASALFEAHERGVMTAADAFAKADTVKGPLYNSRVEGSMEHFIDTVRNSLVGGSGCDMKPRFAPGGINTVEPYYAGTHYPNVVATFPDRGIVRCDQCDKQWEVPFTILDDNDAETISCGTPKEVLNAYITPDEVAASDGDGDEPEVVEGEAEE